jgi:hypothetical protein
MNLRTNLGLLFGLIYIGVCAYLIGTQGLFGESFIALLLGLPWSLLPAFFEFGNVSGAAVYVLIFLPLVVNAAILYWVGSQIGKKFA